MTDIIVTVPSSEERHVVVDKMGYEVEDIDPTDPEYQDCVVEVPKVEMSGDVTPFWNLGRKPKHLTDHDRIYFVLNGEVYARAYVEDIDEGMEVECDITGRKWKGCQVYFCDIEVFPKEKRKKMKGFRGFRYVTKEMKL